MVNNIIYSCIIVNHPVINLGVSFMNIYHEKKIIFINEEKMGGAWQVNHVVPTLEIIA